MKPEYPYNLTRRLSAVGVIAVLLPLPVTWLFFSHCLVQTLVASLVLWVGIAAYLRKAPPRAYLWAGIGSPVIGGCMVLVLSEGFESSLWVVLGFVALMGDLSGVAILICLGIFFAFTMCPIGILMGLAAYQFMRKDVWL